MHTLYQSLVAVEPATLIATICNLFIQMYVVKKFFLNKVLAILDKRRQAAEEEITQAVALVAQQNNMTLEQLKPYMDEAFEASIVGHVLTSKVMKLIRDNAVITVQ